MTTRKDLEIDAKKAGVENPGEMENAEQVKDAKAVAEGKARSYFFPELGISVVAQDNEKAEAKARALAEEGESQNA